jgi:hypothetical protein
VDFDEVADELYGLPPEEFMPARTTYEQQARADGDRALAAEIKALGKPSTAAWVSNVLVRHHREDIENLVELGGLLREAQENLEGDQLRALDVQRRQLVSALTRQARALANQLGHPVSGAVGTQVEETLRAAMADPEAGEALLEGRLTAPMNYSGMGTVVRPTLRVVPPPKEKRPAPEPSRTTDKARSSAEARREEARRAAEERRRREVDEARRAVEDATATAEEAADAAEEERRAAAELAARHDGLVDRVEELMLELARTRDEATRVGSERSRAERRREAAERRSVEAVRARDRAQAHLDRLEAAAPR